MGPEPQDPSSYFVDEGTGAEGLCLAQGHTDSEWSREDLQYCEHLFSVMLRHGLYFSFHFSPLIPL